ncbi:MAG TPA: tetratricopeptide repeat protein, partial [Verrucomicrobiae bacterium]|nr:tetratricopeptide repeat protein [Verrucomicrobiae bacterium]
MKNGARIPATQWWEQDGEIRYRRAGGVVGIPKDQIERIERDPSGSGARAGASPAAAALAAAAPTSPIEPPSAPAGSPEAWRQRLRTLDASLGRPGVDERGLKKEEAILHTLLGNDAARTGDLDESEAEYRLAVDADPKLSAPLLNLARVRLTQGRNDDAETLIQDALVLRPGD